MTARKLDLLSECNDQRMAPREFAATFCRRCRNASCVNAGWATSTWESRMASQVDRLLVNPARADPNDERWRTVASQAFMEVPAGPPPEVWGPGAARVHLAPPEKQVAPPEQFEAARRALSSGTPAAAPEATPPPPAPVSVPVPREESETPAGATPPPPRKLPAHFNTDFPDEGVLIEAGATVPAPARVAPSPAEADPWTPRPKPANLVGRGARIKMGG